MCGMEILVLDGEKDIRDLGGVHGQRLECKGSREVGREKVNESPQEPKDREGLIM